MLNVNIDSNEDVQLLLRLITAVFFNKTISNTFIIINTSLFTCLMINKIITFLYTGINDCNTDISLLS